MKVAINACHGGFGLSVAGENLFAKMKGFELFRYKKTEHKHIQGRNLYVRLDAPTDDDSFLSLRRDFGPSCEEFDVPDEEWDAIDFDLSQVSRSDPDLIETIESLSNAANGPCSDLKVVEVPDDVAWTIENYDGLEWVAEQHRTWS